MDNQELFRMIQQAIVESAEDVKQELKQEITGLRTEFDGLRTEMNGLRTEMNAKFAEIHTRFDQIDEDLDYLKSKVQEHDRDIYLLKKRT